MAFSAVPTAFFGGSYAADSDSFEVPLSFFPEITAGEADESTGDSRKIIYGLLSKWAAVLAALDAGNRPTKMTITKTAGAVNSSGQYNVTFNVGFTLAVSAADVAAES